MMHYWFVILFTSLVSLSAQAFQWQDLWSTPDQQGKELMLKKQYKEAKDRFTRNDWSAAAAYRDEDYQKAADLYKNEKNEQGYYNEGNALAHLEKYKEAIKSYDKALAINPKNQDAINNRKLIEELLKKNKDQQNKDQQNKEQQNKEQQYKEQQNKDQQDKDQQDKDQQNKEKQNKAQQDKEQNNTEEEREKQQAKEQWLRLIPDDPGGLMREKFLRDHLRRQRGWYQ
jgi:Ca-activated chloride channel family protein